MPTVPILRGAIHQFQVIPQAAQGSDSEGRSGTSQGTPITVQGRIVMKPMGGKEQMQTGAIGRFAADQQMVAICPLGTEVSPSDLIVVAGIDPSLNGTWKVSFVTYAQVHLEVNCRLWGSQ